MRNLKSSNNFRKAELENSHLLVSNLLQVTGIETVWHWHGVELGVRQHKTHKGTKQIGK